MSHNDDDTNIIIKVETVACLGNKILFRLVKAKSNHNAAADVGIDVIGVDQQQQAAIVVAALIDDAVELLQNQWPQQQQQQKQQQISGDDITTILPFSNYYRDKLIHHRTSGDNYGLPCSYLLVNNNNSSNGGDSCCGNNYCLLGYVSKR